MSFAQLLKDPAEPAFGNLQSRRDPDTVQLLNLKPEHGHFVQRHSDRRLGQGNNADPAVATTV